MEKNKNVFPLVVIFVVVMALVGGAYWFGKNSIQNNAVVDVREVSDDETGESRGDAESLAENAKENANAGLSGESNASAVSAPATGSSASAGSSAENLSASAADSASGTSSSSSAPEESNESVIETLKLLFAQKYEKRIDDVFVTISKREGDYLVGGVTFAGEEAGANVLAAKVNGSWKIIFDGNGMWTCDVVDVVDFPSTLVPECLDGSTMEVVNRAGR